MTTPSSPAATGTNSGAPPRPSPPPRSSPLPSNAPPSNAAEDTMDGPSSTSKRQAAAAASIRSRSTAGSAPDPPSRQHQPPQSRQDPTPMSRVISTTSTISTHGSAESGESGTSSRKVSFSASQETPYDEQQQQKPSHRTSGMGQPPHTPPPPPQSVLRPPRTVHKASSTLRTPTSAGSLPSYTATMTNTSITPSRAPSYVSPPASISEAEDNTSTLHENDLQNSSYYSSNNMSTQAVLPPPPPENDSHTYQSRNPSPRSSPTKEVNRSASTSPDHHETKNEYSHNMAPSPPQVDVGGGYLPLRHPNLPVLQKEDSNWRCHGQAFRARLIEHDEDSGRHDFEMSDGCSLKRYHLVAEKVLLQFLATRDDPHVNLRDTYLVGTRLSKFLSTVLPTHKDFHSPDPELSELRRQSHGRWLALSHYLEELALIIDEEEHNRFVLRDLNDTTLDDNNNPLAAASDHPPPPMMVIASPKKSRKPRSNNNTTGMSEDPTTQPSSHLGDIDCTSDRRQNRHAGNDADLDGDEGWKNVDATTVVSLDTQWFSSAGFSDPFPLLDTAAMDGPALTPTQQQAAQELKEHEQIVQITGANSKRRSRPDHKDVDFTNMSLADESQVLDYFAQKAANQTNSAPPAAVVSVVSPSPTKDNSQSNDRDSWRIAPFPSTKESSHEPSPLSPDTGTFKTKWGCSPFQHHSPKGKSSSMSDRKPRISWVPPESEGRTSTPYTAVTEEMASWWDASTDERKSPAITNPGKVPQNLVDLDDEIEKPLHEKVSSKSAARRSSRYMSLDELEAHQKKQAANASRGKRVAPTANAANQERLQQAATSQSAAAAQARASSRRSDDPDDEDLAKSSLILDSNKARAKDDGVEPYRHRGMHHFKECVRCLLE